MDIFGTGQDTSAHSSGSQPRPMTPEQIKRTNDMIIACLCLIGAMVFSLSAIDALILLALYRAAERKADSGKWLGVITAFFFLASLHLLFFGYGSITLGILPTFWGKDLLNAILHSPLHRLSWFRTNNPLLTIQDFAFLSLAASPVLFWILKSWMVPSPSDEEEKIAFEPKEAWMLNVIDPLGLALHQIFEFLSTPITSLVRVALSETKALGGKGGITSFFLFIGLVGGLLLSLNTLDPAHFIQTAHGVGLFLFLGALAVFSLAVYRKQIHPAIYGVFAPLLAFSSYFWVTNHLDLRTFLIVASIVLALFYLRILSSLEFLLRPFFGLGGEDSSALKRESIVIGRDEFDREVSLTKDMINHHVHVVGASGFGKTNFLSHLLFQTIDQGRGLLFLDLKADLEMLEAVKSQCQRAHRLQDLKVFSLADPHISISHNLLQHGDASELKDKLIGAFQWSDPFYEKEAESFLLRVFRAFVFLREQKKRSFHLGDLYQCLIDPKSLLLLANELSDEEGDIREDLLELAREMESPKKRDHLLGLKSEIENLLKAEFGKLLQSNEGLDLFQSMQKNEVVYLLLDSRRYGKTAERLGRMVIQDISTASGKRGMLPKENNSLFTVVIDEFAPLVTESFVRLLQQARSSNIGIVIAHQELADLRVFSEATQNQIMQNTSTTVAFLQKLPDSAELLAGMIGTFETKELTRQKNDQASFLEPPYTGMASERHVEKFNVHPNIFKRLPRGECVLISKYPKHSAVRLRVAKAERLYVELTSKEERMVNASSSNLNQCPIDLKTLRKAYQDRMKSKLTPPIETIAKEKPSTPGDSEWFS